MFDETDETMENTQCTPSRKCTASKDKEMDNIGKMMVNSIIEEMSQSNELTELVREALLKLNISPVLPSESKTIRPSDNRVNIVSNNIGMDAASTSVATSAENDITNDSVASTNLSNISHVSPHCKSEIIPRRREIQQSKHLSINNEGNCNGIASAGSKWNLQAPVQINTDAKEYEHEKGKTKRHRNRNKTKAIELDKKNMLNTYDKQPHQENGTKEIKGNVTRNKKDKAKKEAKRKEEPIFADYIPVPEMMKILEAQTSNGQFIKGNLRINTAFAKYAYLRMENTEERDLLIIGARCRNHAFDGDLVVAKINPKELWFTFTDGTTQVTGTVVCILEKLNPRVAVGHLKCQNSQLVLCIPRDLRIPIINIQPESLPLSYVEQPNLHENTLFYVKIDSWEQSHASGRVLSIVGESGEIGAELEAILLENDLDVSPYRDELLDEFPDSDTLTDDDIKDREDWRNECVFSIDPATTVDIDDLVSCKPLDNGNYQVGVHISDVTHYLKFSSLLDVQVSKRATSVYMPHIVYHMLPERLCHICSLHAGKDRLAFSIIWEMTADAEIVKQRFAKTVVRSCCEMPYESAQAMIDNPDNPWPEDFLDVKGDYTPSMLCDVVNNLVKLSRKMRGRRFDNGVLKLDKPQLLIRFDRALTWEGKIPKPVGHATYEATESHSLIEEFMLLANTAVAVRLHDAIPETAFIRIHKDPFKCPLVSLCDRLRKYGFHLNIETAGALHASIQRYESGSFFADPEQKKNIMMAIVNLCSATMARAEYVCASTIPLENTKHYALSVPFYTHFTSPIRRYADCVVHRLLSVVIEDRPLPEEWTVKLCSSIAANCNVKKYNAKLVQEQSTKLFFAQMIDLAGGYEASAIALNVKEDSLDVILCDCGLKFKIYFKEATDIAKQKYFVAYEVPAVTVHWKGRPVPEVINMFSVVRIRIEKIEKTLQLKAILLPLQRDR